MVPEFPRIKRLPPYVFNITNELKMAGQLGALYNNYGLVDQAIATLSRILELDPDETGALHMLGYLYAGKKREMDKAIGMQRRHVAILPRHPNSHDSMGDVYFMAHRYDEAELPSG